MRRPTIIGTSRANGTDAVRILRSDGIVVRERTYASRSILKEHAHEYAVLVLVLEGEFNEWCRGRVELRRPSTRRNSESNGRSTRCRGPDTEIARVALEAGFSDQAHFTRRFRNHTGTTPGEYRKARAANRHWKMITPAL